ncbi:hypothetical protein G6F71_004662 [Rhizopus microsporus]|nr:hypothetical protein G6F71_004662 [Rhizopus microsporus]KAG1211514.1 hypothetical protein G6F69_004535 [Rhizopus microsporus]KAG1234720.1 hypothetical protein G6F67_003309 [Rhizopus microsporus]
MFLPNRSKRNISGAYEGIFKKEEKKANETVDELKNCLLQAKKLPTGIITSAAELAGCDTRQMRSFVENRPGMTNVEEWKVIVDKHFDETLESLTSRLDSMMVSSPFSTTIDTVEEKQFCTFTALFDKLIRKDIPLNIKEVIMKKISFSMSGSTDFVVCFSTLIQMLLIQLKNSVLFWKTMKTFFFVKLQGSVWQASFSSLNALHLNAPTLYQLLTQELTKVDQDQSSDQEEKPTSLKTVRILGTQEKMVNILNEPKKASYKERVLKNPNVILEGQKSKESLSAEIKSLSDVIKQLEGDLKKTLNFQNESDFSRQIHALKNQWGKENNDKLHKDIETLKIARDLSYEKIHQLKDELAQTRQQLYFKQMANRYHVKLTKSKEISLNNRAVRKKNEKGLSNAEARELITPEDFLFADTDNGLVKMTTSVPLSLQRAKFHLKLYKYYAVLENAEMDEALQLDLNDEEKSFLDLPKIIKTSAETGKEEERERRRKKIQALEDAMSKASTDSSANTIDGLASNFRPNFDNRTQMRAFYCSAKSINQQRHIEVQKARYCHQLCRKERLKLMHTAENDDKSKKLLMFVGDRGTGVGSRVKGFMRYGGKWKENMHAEAINVCVTNENKKSQICVFCFKKLAHPKRKEVKNGKAIFKSINGAFICTNPSCVSVKNRRAVKSRDALSALAIGLVGFSTVLFGVKFPAFNTISQNNTEDFINITSAFLNRSVDRQLRCGSGVTASSLW